MDTCMVLYSIWEMECCGIEFGVDDNVKWVVVRDFSLVSEIKEDIDYVYSAHEQYEENKFYILEGKVRDIRILYEKYVPSIENPRLLVPTDSKMISANHSSEYEDELDGMRSSAYIVKMEDYTIRPAKAGEVAYC